MSAPHPLSVPPALRSFFEEHPAAAIAFSGGADSAYLLYAAIACGCRVRAYYLHGPFQPAFELADARRLAQELSADLSVLDLDLLANPKIASNPPDRCYHCKRALFSALLEAAHADGFPVLLDGTNASDDPTDRPGIRALRELSVLFPLALSGIGKAELRALSRQAGLFTWNKPAYACLATRVPAGDPLTASLLRQIEQSEEALFSLGFSDFRVRVFGGAARIQLPAAQLPAALQKRREILDLLSPHWWAVLLDLQERPAVSYEENGSIGI